MAGNTAPRALVEGTPDYLLQPLQNWLLNAVFQRGVLDLNRSLNLRLQREDIIVRDSANRPLVPLAGEELLEVIDAALAVYSWLLDRNERVDLDDNQWWAAMAVDLQMILEEGGSAWRPNDGFDGLTRRVDETVANAVRTVIQSAPQEAAHHLRRAWEQTYGRKPDPSVAYSEAVKAVEAVAIPAVVPKVTTPTLGKALGTMNGAAAKWEMVIDDEHAAPASADSAIKLMELLWCGHRDRHPAGATSKPVTQEQAEAAVQAAVLLVQWFTSGAIRKKP